MIIRRISIKEKIVIDDKIIIRILSIGRKKLKVAVEAPRNVKVVFLPCCTPLLGEPS